MRFPIVIHKDKDEGSGYGVIVPDLPGCFSAGDTLEDALMSSQEAKREGETRSGLLTQAALRYVEGRSG